jgi:hypothetical protein
MIFFLVLHDDQDLLLFKKICLKDNYFLMI